MTKWYWWPSALTIWTKLGMKLSSLVRISWIATISNRRTTSTMTRMTSGLPIFDVPKTWMLNEQMVIVSPVSAGG